MIRKGISPLIYLPYDMAYDNFRGGGIESEDRFYADFVEQAYAFQTQKAKPNFKGTYKFVMGDNFSVVYANDKEIVYAIRGTIPSYPRDLVLDSLVVFDKLEKTPEFQHLNNLADMLSNQAKATGKRLIICGHSLGASFVLKLLMLNMKLLDTIHRAYLYNTGTGVRQWIKQNIKHLVCKGLNIFTKKITSCKHHAMMQAKMRVLSAGFDPLSILSSAMGLNSERVDSKMGLISSHSLSNFTNTTET